MNKQRITSLPSRYEPLTLTFGDRARATFVAAEDDLGKMKRLIASSESSHQGKLWFLCGESGSGKSTFVHSAEIFIPDKIAKVVRLPLPHELAIEDITGFVASMPKGAKKTVVNFDGREAPSFEEPRYRTFLGSLNALLRSREDLLIIWPVTDRVFAEKLVVIMKAIAGNSPFGPEVISIISGLKKESYNLVLGKILQIANWSLADAAIEQAEVEPIIAGARSVGVFLDNLQKLITERFDIEVYGVEFPNLVIAISSGESKLREVCRALRRADSFYVEASRLLMYTKKSNAAEWWNNRATDIRAALPHVIALFNVQLVSLSASSIVHAVLQFGDDELKSLVEDVRADKGNARRVMEASELFKYVIGEGSDNREYGSSVKDATYTSYDRIQERSETKHKLLNKAIIELVIDAGATMDNLDYETTLTKGLQTDVTYRDSGTPSAIEFHHKATSEANQNKIAIYILEKLKEYAINFGIAVR